MNDSVYEQIQEAAEYLKLELSAQEMAELSIEQGLGENGIQAVSKVLQYLQGKKKEGSDRIHAPAHEPPSASRAKDLCQL